MQSVKLKVSVRNHRIAEELPPEVPDGEAEVVIHFEERSTANVELARRRHLEGLFQDIEHSGEATLKREEIDRLIAEERASWGD